MQYWDDGLISVSKKKNDELWHFGIKGMKWGIRRYQNEDGSLTPAGKARYDDGTSLSSRNTSTAKSTSKKTAREKEAIYEKQKSLNQTIMRAGYRSKLAGAASYAIGQTMYDKYKTHATPAQAATIQAMGYTYKVLNNVGNALVLGSFLKSHVDFAKKINS